MPVADGVHLGGTSSLAAGTNHIGHLVINPEERHRATRDSTATDCLALGPDRRQVGAGAGAKLEEHPLTVRQLEDRLQVVINRLDETGAALRVLVLRRGALCMTNRIIVIPVALRRVIAHAILVMQPDVEPYRRVEGTILVQAEPRQLLVKNLAILPAEVTVVDAPVRDGADHAMDQLANGRLPLRRVLLAKEIFRDDDLGRKLRPVLGHLDVFLLENDLAALVGNLRRAGIPLDFIVGISLGIAEHPLDLDARTLFALGQAAPFRSRHFWGSGAARGAGSGRGQRVVCVDHGLSGVYGCLGQNNRAWGRSHSINHP